MTNEDLKAIWSHQDRQGKPIMIPPESIWRLAEKSARFERTIFWRDTREWLATAFVVGAFLFYALRHQTVHWLPIVAAIIACLPMSYVAFLRRKRPPLKSSRSLTDHLRESIASVQHQIGLLGSVLWWYLAPLALSWMLVFVDRVRSARLLAGAYSGPELLFSAAFAVAIFVGVWKLNERAVRKDLEPRLRELEKTLTELEA